jgi:mevalonate kinase
VIKKNKGLPAMKDNQTTYYEGDIYIKRKISKNTKFKLLFKKSTSFPGFFIIKVWGFYQKNTSILWARVDSYGNLVDFRLEYR